MADADTFPGSGEVGLANVGSLIGDASRAAMLSALLDGRALTAGELARVAWITPQTASGHLSRLVDGGLLTLEVQGRHRYYRITNAEVAHAIEALSAVSAPQVRQPGTSLNPPSDIRRARTCYDHLAGQLGVGLADALVDHGVLVRKDREFAVSAPGEDWLRGVGVDVDRVRESRRKFATTCLDWTERRHHVGGALGAALASACFEQQWVARIEGSRALRVTVAGRRAFERVLRLSLDAPVSGQSTQFSA